MLETQPAKNTRPNAFQGSILDAGLLWLFFLFLIYYKRPELLAQGRFFAEEGTLFFRDLCNASLFKAVGYLYLGRLELFTNLAAWLASFFPLELAPRVTVYCALAIQSLPVLLLGYGRKELRISLPGCFLFVLLAVSLPQMIEVLLTTTSAHFHFAFLAALILLLRAPRDWNRHLFRVLLVCCGLSGVTAHFLLPFFLVRSYLEKDRERLIQAAVLGATTLLQICLIVFSHEHREATQAFLPTILSFIIHQMITPFIGIQAMDGTAGLIRRLPEHFYAGVPLLLAALITWGTAWVILLRTRRPVFFYLLALDLFLTAAFTLLSLADMRGCMGLFCMRYFFLQNCLFVLALVMGLVPASWPGNCSYEMSKSVERGYSVST